MVFGFGHVISLAFHTSRTGCSSGVAIPRLVHFRNTHFDLMGISCMQRSG